MLYVFLVYFERLSIFLENRKFSMIFVIAYTPCRSARLKVNVFMNMILSVFCELSFDEILQGNQRFSF